MINKYVPYLFFLLFIIQSCDYEKEIDLKTFPPKACLNAVVQQDSLLYFLVYRTIADAGTGSPYIEDAELSVQINGKEYRPEPVISFPGQYYIPEYRAQEGDNISVDVQTTTYDPLQAQTVVPRAPEIISLECIYEEEDLEYFEEPFLNLNGTLKFRDESKEKKYYVLFFINSTVSRETGEAVMEYASTEINKIELTNHPEFYLMETYYIYDFGLLRNENYVNGNYFMFTSDHFRNGIYEIPFTAYDLQHSYSYTPITHTSLKVCLYSISLSYYLYLQSKYNQSGNWVWGEEFREPLPTFTNVKGGFGLFSALSGTSSINIKKEK